LAASLNTAKRAECYQQLMRSELRDYRELFTGSDINGAFFDSIGKRNSSVNTWGCGGFWNETNIYRRGKRICF
ncbi:hypothetical protein, partial [Escherichia coli]|uniref:hypothetical protein n=1 Tax=Escherichia coli TaxID=562 RepID=UPI00234C0DBD